MHSDPRHMRSKDIFQEGLLSLNKVGVTPDVIGWSYDRESPSRSEHPIFSNLAKHRVTRHVGRESGSSVRLTAWDWLTLIAASTFLPACEQVKGPSNRSRTSLAMKDPAADLSPMTSMSWI